MTTSNELYVWTWLPGETEPVVAGRIEQSGPLVTFVYGLNYRSRPDAISLFTPELPLRAGIQEPADGLNIAGVLRDGSPDRWAAVSSKGAKVLRPTPLPSSTTC